MGLLLIAAAPYHVLAMIRLSGDRGPGIVVPAAPHSACNRHAAIRIPPPAVGKCRNSHPDELRAAGT